MLKWQILHLQNPQSWFHVKSEIEKCWIFHTVGNEWDSVNAKWSESENVSTNSSRKILKVSEWDSPRISTTVYLHFGERQFSSKNTLLDSHVSLYNK